MFVHFFNENYLDLSKLKVKVLPGFAIKKHLMIRTSGISRNFNGNASSYYYNGHYTHAPSISIELTFKTFGQKTSQLPFSEPTRQDDHFGI